MYEFNQEDPANVKYGDNPGYGDILFCPVEDFTTIAGTTASPSADGDTRIVPTNHTFPVGKGFIKGTLYREGTDVKGESKGEIGFQSMEYTGKGMFVGDSEFVIERSENLLNRAFIVLIKDPDCATDTYRQLGCNCDPAILSKLDFNSGTKISGGKKGYDVSFTAKCLLHYTGTVTLKA